MFHEVIEVRGKSVVNISLGDSGERGKKSDETDMDDKDLFPKMRQVEFS